MKNLKFGLIICIVACCFPMFGQVPLNTFASNEGRFIFHYPSSFTSCAINRDTAPHMIKCLQAGATSIRISIWHRNINNNVTAHDLNLRPNTPSERVYAIKLPIHNREVKAIERHNVLNAGNRPIQTITYQLLHYGSLIQFVITLTDRNNTNFGREARELMRGLELRGSHTHQAGTMQDRQRQEQYGVVINGVRWATGNMVIQGRFIDRIENVEHSGVHFTWEQAQNVCPQGWRLPTTNELRSLIGTRSEWLLRGGSYGRIFGNANNQTFLPAAGLREWYNDQWVFSNVGEFGVYWSNTDGYILMFSQNNYNVFNADPSHRALRFSVRCVAINP